MSSLSHYAPLAGRVLIGLAFAIHGITKIFKFGDIVDMLAGIGFPLATAFAVILIAIEIGAGALLIFNIATQWAAYALVLVLVVATLFVHAPSIDMANLKGTLGSTLNHLLMIGGLLAVAGASRTNPPAAGMNSTPHANPGDAPGV